MKPEKKERIVLTNVIETELDILKRITDNSSKEKIETSEVNLWSNEWLMGLAILLFGFEWFLRKRFGML